jgi:hypothetical protein
MMGVEGQSMAFLRTNALLTLTPDFSFGIFFYRWDIFR